MTMFSSNLETNTKKISMRTIVLIAIALLFFVGIIFILSKNTSKKEPALPASLQVPLYQNKKTVKAEKNSFGQQEIMFYSLASAQEITRFYQGWASQNGFVFFSKQEAVGENKKEFVKSKLDLPERQMFALLPALGKTNLFTYNFILEPQKNVTRIILVYSENIPKPEEIKNIPVPKSFKLKL